jgi:hypothetical protein
MFCLARQDVPVLEQWKSLVSGLAVPLSSDVVNTGLWLINSAAYAVQMFNVVGNMCQ